MLQMDRGPVLLQTGRRERVFFTSVAN